MPLTPEQKEKLLDLHGNAYIDERGQKRMQENFESIFEFPFRQVKFSKIDIQFGFNHDQMPVILRVKPSRIWMQSIDKINKISTLSEFSPNYLTEISKINYYSEFFGNLNLEAETYKDAKKIVRYSGFINAERNGQKLRIYNGVYKLRLGGEEEIRKAQPFEVNRPYYISPEVQEIIGALMAISDFDQIAQNGLIVARKFGNELSVQAIALPYKKIKRMLQPYAEVGDTDLCYIPMISTQLYRNTYRLTPRFFDKLFAKLHPVAVIC